MCFRGNLWSNVVPETLINERYSFILRSIWAVLGGDIIDTYSSSKIDVLTSERVRETKMHERSCRVWRTNVFHRMSTFKRTRKWRVRKMLL